jgi:hypothetical protein
MAYTARDLLAAVERSPRAAAAHDRAGWVGLFTGDGRIEDPVGSRPHVGTTQISRFYDTFIGPRDIVFHRDLDIVRGPVVIRDLDLEVAMGSAVTMTIPAFLRYDLREVNGDWKIAVLRAYWELPAMMLQFLRHGARALPAVGQLSHGLVCNQRLAGTVGFLSGLRRPGAHRKRLVDAFVTNVACGDKPAAVRILSPGAPMTLGDDEGLDLAALVAQLDGAGCTKTIAAGSTVAVSITADQGRGVLFADLARSGQITRLRYFPG